MDKKQDRQFYWEVKDFMSSKKKINENVNKPSRVVDSVKTILEQNKPYKQATNGSNSNTVNSIRQALDQIQNNEKTEFQDGVGNLYYGPFKNG
jgi:response regulator of citrate/malate metabolism